MKDLEGTKKRIHVDVLEIFRLWLNNSSSLRSEWHFVLTGISSPKKWLQIVEYQILKNIKNGGGDFLKDLFAYI